MEYFLLPCSCDWASEWPEPTHLELRPTQSESFLTCDSLFIFGTARSYSGHGATYFSKLSLNAALVGGVVQSVAQPRRVAAVLL